MIDPSYAPAAALVGWCRVLQRVRGWGALSDEDIAEACLLVLRSIQLIQLYRTVESIEGKRHLSPGAVAAGFGMLSHIRQVPNVESSDWI